MEIVIAASAVAVSVAGGILGGFGAILKLSFQLKKRFDTTDERLAALHHKYDLQRERDMARIELVEYKLGEQKQLIEHKFKRCENAIWQLSKYLETHHNYRPRAVFPLETTNDD